jgi:hypothetical protein
MVAPTPLQDLAVRIQQQEAELAKLRQELETRQAHLLDLARRKAELQAELQKIDQEIEAVGQNGMPTKTPSTSNIARKPVPAKTLGETTKGISMPKYLVGLVQQANGPITAKELTEQAVRNKFPTTSNNLEGIIKSRLYDLVKNGALRRVGDSGFVAAKAAAKPVEAKASVGAATNGKKTSAPAAPAQPTKWRSLLEVLAHVMSKSSRPLSAQELADKVLAKGYESKSKDLKNVIWVSIKKLPGVENIPGEGYRLKKGKVAGKKG